MKEIVIFGTGEIAELAHYYFEQDSDYKVAAFTADDAYVADDTFRGLPLIPFSEIETLCPPTKYGGHVALSYNKLNQVRETKYHAMKEKAYELVSYVCTRSVYWPDLDVGDNCFILENQTIQPTVKIGSNVMIWSGNHLGHGCVINDHTYISSHVCISGHTEIGTHCFFGVNSTARDFIKIGNRVFVAMNAMIVSNVPDDAVVVGAKGTVFQPGSDTAVKLRKRYFNI